MRAEERKTGKIGAEVVTVGPGTGGNPLLVNCREAEGVV